ncbi:histidine kinase [Algoriphagus machipongonensis]|uniref:histidine kinase n=1 Tax=Algoriphagus machipongonensis TaxID=388413 RepID=UPI0000F3AA43|nr:sensor histidine kinase [Algoriphagus machipongonensis]
MTKVLRHNPLTRLLLPLGVGALVYLCVLLAFDTVGTALQDFFTRELIFCIVCSYLILEGNRLLIHFLESKLTSSFEFKNQVIKLLVFTIAGSLLITSGMLISYFSWFENMTDPRVYTRELQIFNGLFLFVSLMYQGHYAGYYYIHNKFQKELDSEKKEKELLEKNKDLFHYMMNPEFLLVGLESILIRIKEKNFDLADEGILLLADIYRHSLKNQEELVPLKEELRAMQCTQIFLKQFVSKNICLSPLPESDDMLIVPRTLTKILEAIAYSQLSSESMPLPLSLELAENHLVLNFESNFSLTKTNLLQNTLKVIKSQYGWLNDKLYWKDLCEFSIYIPLEQPFKAKYQEQNSNK